MNVCGRRDFHDLDALGASRGTYILRRGFVVDDRFSGAQHLESEYVKFHRVSSYWSPTKDTS